jgi:HEPN domain-containing protein
MFESRGQAEAIASVGADAAHDCLARARDRMEAAEILLGTGHWEAAYATAYDAYRMAADAVVLALGYRVPAVSGAHRITIDIADAAIGETSDVFAGAAAERFRMGRHQLEYFDPERPQETTEGDARWATSRAATAIEAVSLSLRA